MTSNRRSQNSTALLWLLSWIALLQPNNIHAFSQDSDASCQSSIDVTKFKERIQAGRVYQHFDFLSKQEVDLLWKEIQHLEKSGGFERSGLSNTATINQFGSQDRTLCPVAWWPASLLGTNAVSPAGQNVQEIATRIQELRLSLATLLDRPTMADASLDHECYYSMSQVGSRLPRHMDERHEELKGSKGWLLPSRRSLSWLIYLSDPGDWTLEENGGALRSYPPKASVGGSLTQDQGNLQIGWLLDNESRPVYLNSWFPVSSAPDQPPEPHCILYTRNQEQELVFLTQPWLSEGVQGTSLADFIQNWARRQSNNPDDPGLFLRADDANQFTLIEDRPAWDRGEEPEGTEVEDIVPTRGSLVIFDSVTMPHQVEAIKKGKRVALAGWFHEATQPFPEGLYA